MKRKIQPPPPPAPPECPNCTTPHKCGSKEWQTKKGPRCVGGPNGKDRCDCLNDCGDDPWIQKGLSEPCNLFHVYEEERRATDEALSAIRARLAPKFEEARIKDEQEET